MTLEEHLAVPYVLCLESVPGPDGEWLRPSAFGAFAVSTTLPLLPAHLLSGVGYNALPRDPFNQRPIGTGPFRVAESDPRQVVLTPSDDFYQLHPDRVRPYLDRLVLRSYPDTAQALTALEGVGPSIARGSQPGHADSSGCAHGARRNRR